MFETVKNKYIADLILNFAMSILIINTVGCTANNDNLNQGLGLNGGVTSGGQTKACPINLLIGRTYSGAGVEISFLPDNKASVSIASEDHPQVIDYKASAVECTVLMNDPLVPALSQTRQFFVSHDLMKILDFENLNVVFNYVKGGALCVAQDSDLSLVGKTFISPTKLTLRFIDDTHFSFDDGRDIQTYTFTQSKLILHIHDGEDSDHTLSVLFSENSVRLISEDPIEGVYQRINCE